MRDGAAAGTDLHHLDHGNPQWQTGAFAEAPDACDLERARGLRLAIVDQADLRGGAAHVERQHVGDAAFARDGGGEDCATGGTAFHQADRETTGGFDRGQAAARQHQEHRCRYLEATQPVRKIAQIARHQRLHVGVGDRGGEAFPLAHLGRHFAGKRYRNIRQCFSQNVAGTAFVHRVDKGVEETDGDAFDAFALQDWYHCPHGCGVEWQQNVAFVVQAFGYGQAQVARNQRFGQHDVQVVLVVTALIAHRDHVAKALGGDQRGAGAFAFDHRVGGERGAVDDDADIAGSDAGGLQDAANARQHALLGCG